MPYSLVLKNLVGILKVITKCPFVVIMLVNQNRVKTKTQIFLIAYIHLFFLFQGFNRSFYLFMMITNQLHGKTFVSLWTDEMCRSNVDFLGNPFLQITQLKLNFLSWTNAMWRFRSPFCEKICRVCTMYPPSDHSTLLYPSFSSIFVPSK